MCLPSLINVAELSRSSPLPSTEYTGIVGGFSIDRIANIRYGADGFSNVYNQTRSPQLEEQMYKNGMQMALQWILLQLFEIDAVKFGGFKLKLHQTNPDAPLSPFFFNLRTPDNPKPGRLTPQIVNAITLAMAERLQLRPVVYKHIAGIPNAGNPFAKQLHLIQNNPDNPGPKPGLIVLGKTVTDSERKVDSIITFPENFAIGDPVLVLDDLITWGDSKLETIDALTHAGFTIARIETFIDREQGGSSQLIEAGYEFDAVLNISTILDFYLLAGKITGQQRTQSLEYIKLNSQ